MGILLTEAAADPAMGTGGLIGGSLLYLVVIFGAMWFFMMRPQSKEKKRLASMLASLELGLEAYLVTDCLINRENRELSGIKHGSFADFCELAELC